MSTDKPRWEIAPAHSGCAKSWMLYQLEWDGCGNVKIRTTIAWFKTIKAAKAMAAHLGRKPIRIK